MTFNNCYVVCVPDSNPQALLTSRRFLNTVISSTHVLVRCTASALAANEHQGRLFRQLLEMLRFYVGFEITDFSGEPLTDAAMLLQHYTRVGSVQVMGGVT